MLLSRSAFRKRFRVSRKALEELVAAGEVLLVPRGKRRLVEFPDHATTDGLGATIRGGRAARPRPGWVSLSAAEERLHQTDAVLTALAALGVLEAEWKDGRVSALRLDEDATFASICDGFHRHPGRCESVEDFERFRKIAVRLLHGPAPRIPPSIVDDAFEYWKAAGIKPSERGLTSLLGGPRELTREIWATEAPRRGLIGKRLTVRKFGWRRGEDFGPEVLERLPDAVRGLPGTPLDEVEAVRRLAKGPHPSELKRLAAIRNVGLFGPLSALVHWLPSQEIAPNQIRETLACLTAMDEFAADRDLRDPETVRAVLLEALGPEWRVSQDVGFSRLNIVKRFYWMTDRFAEMLAAMPASAAHRLEAIAPVLPTGSVALRGKVTDALARQRRSYGAERAVRLERIFDNPAELEQVGRARLDEHRAILARIDEAISEATAEGSTIELPHRFSLPYKTIDDDGLADGLEQTIHLELTTWPLLLDLVREAARGDPTCRSRWSAGKNVPVSGRASFAVRFVGLSPGSPGGPTRLPVVAELAVNDLLDTTNDMSAAQLRRQQEARKRLDLDLTSWRTTTGLPNFPRGPARVARGASKHLDFAILPIRETVLGMTYAYAGCCTCLDAGCRWHEASQAVLPFQEIDPPAGSDEEHYVFEAVPKKQEAKRGFPITGRTLDVVLDMVELVQTERLGSRPLPVVEGNPDHVRKGIPPAAFVFSTGSAILMHDQMSMCLRTLFLGWGRIKGHDPRHLFNNLAENENVSKRDRMAAMSQEREASNDVYGPRTPAQIALARTRMRQHEAARDGRRGLASIPPEHHKEAKGILRRIRLAEANIRALVEEEQALDDDPDLVDARTTIAEGSARLAALGSPLATSRDALDGG